MRLLLSDLVRSRDPIIEGIHGLASGSWDRDFETDVRACSGFMAARIMGLMSDRLDCTVSYGRVAVSSINMVNPQRIAVTPQGGYPILRSRLSLDPTYDSVPLSVGRSARGVALWDGHRRFETYQAAGRNDCPAWIASFRFGTGFVIV